MAEAGADRDGEGALRCYANALRVVTSLSEVELAFAQDGGSGPDIRARIITSPSHLPVFHSALAGAISDYEQRYALLPREGKRG